jgi:polysaccharide pyruvyl transferase WcaK-like protein
MLSMDNVTAWGVRGFASIATLPKFETWKKGEKLKILLVGYNGKRNTGADVRVCEMVKQYYRILGEENIEISVMTLDTEMTEVYFQPPTNQIQFSTIFFKDLLDACDTHHMAVLCEGSTLKSKFANALTLFFCEAAGVMKKQGKPCFAYGSEAGDMDPFVKKLASDLCSETYFIARTEASLDIVKGMGLKGHMGTDTAWTFTPAPPEWAEKELKDKTGWDGKKPVLGVAIINPFWWPVSPSLTRLAEATVKKDWDYHMEKYYFFSDSPERRAAFEAYVKALSGAANEFCKSHDAHVVAIGMEALDLDACEKFCSQIDGPTGYFSSKFYDGFQMGSVLHKLSLLVTSRYHARVLSSTGGVPSIAVSMDERLYNIFNECGHIDDYYLKTDDPKLREKLSATMDRCWDNREQVTEQIECSIPGYLRTMSDMGKFFRGWLEEQFDGIEFAAEPKDWQGYLPELNDRLKAILKEEGK